jgi:hypothetical protein
MDLIVSFIPILLMIIVGYYIFRYYNKKNKAKFKDDLSEQEEAIWKKSRWGLFFIIPFIAIFDIINNNMTGSKQNLVPTILNFFITRFIVKSIIKRGFNINYPKLAAIGISILIFILQVAIGLLIGNKHY